MATSCPPPSTSDGTGADGTREEQARNVCLRLLTARARTRAELAGQLARRGYPADVGTRVLDGLAGVGLIDDRDFAEHWVRSRRDHAGRGKRALAAELRTKGVAADVIASALSDIDADAERARAVELAADKLRREPLVDDPAAAEKVLRRLVGMLARRGYHPGLALDVATQALHAEREHRAV